MQKHEKWDESASGCTFTSIYTQEYVHLQTLRSTQRELTMIQAFRYSSSRGAQL